MAGFEIPRIMRRFHARWRAVVGEREVNSLAGLELRGRGRTFAGVGSSHLITEVIGSPRFPPDR